MDRIYLVDVTVEALEVDGEKGEDKKKIIACSSEKTLFDAIASIVDTRYEEKTARIDRVVQHNHNGAILSVDLIFKDGNIQLQVGGEILGELPTPEFEGDVPIDGEIPGLEEDKETGEKEEGTEVVETP